MHSRHVTGAQLGQHGGVGIQADDGSAVGAQGHSELAGAAAQVYDNVVGSQA
jgi:hypothetical protein